MTFHFNISNIFKEPAVDGKLMIDNSLSKPGKIITKQPTSGTSIEHAGIRNTSAETSMH